MGKNIWMRIGTGLFLMGLMLGVVSCAVNPVSGQRQLMLISEADEIKIGKNTDGQVKKQYGVYDDPELFKYLDGIYKEIIPLSHRPNLPYQLQILDTPVINAFAVPGGYVYMTRGILAHLNSEAEFAGVLGHELGHITARHSAQQISKAQLAQVGLGVGMVLSETVRSYAGLAQFGVGMLFLKFSRDNERESDDLGVEYASKAGYDSAQMADFFKTLDMMKPASQSGGLPEWFSTHPAPANRQETVKQRTTEWQEKLGSDKYQVKRNQYLKRIDGLVFGEDPRQGYVDDNVFYHPGLRFQFPVPAGWKLQNTQSLVRMVSEKEDALIMFSLSQGASPKEVAQKFVEENKAEVLKSGKIRVNNLAAFQVISQLTTEQGKIKLLSFFIKKDPHIYVFHGVTSVEKYKDYGPIFRKTMQRFNSLNDPEKINVKPDRIEIKRARRGETIGDILKRRGIPKEQIEEIALLNGMLPEDPVSARSLIKVVKKGRERR